MYVGFGGSGTLTVSGGGSVVDSIAYVGYNSGVTGEVTVTGLGSTWESTDYLCVGRNGTGTLDIIEGGRVVVATDGSVGARDGSHGTVTVNGEQSVWENGRYLYIGFDTGSEGTLSIQNGGSVSNTYGYIGHVADSQGSVSVAGSGSTWTNSADLYVGRYGTGTLNITVGGSVSNTLGYIGRYSGSTGTVTVNGTGSTWESTGDLSLGRSSDSGVGELNVSAGGTVYVGDAAKSGGAAGCLTVSDADGSGTAGGHLYVYHGSTLTHAGAAVVGYDVGEYGWATVDGTGSTWTNDSYLCVARYGTGTLEISSGGSVTNTDGYIGSQNGSHGTVTVDASTWDNSNDLYVGYYGAGVLTVQNGGSVSNKYGYIGGYSDATGTVTVNGEDSKWTNSFDLYVGAYGTGTLAITEGGLVSVAGMLIIDCDTDYDSFINMSTGGMLALVGDADDSLTQFLGLIIGTDAINYWNGSTSDWAPITGATPGVDYTLTYIDTTGSGLYGYTLLTVGISSAVPGDANVDGVVNELDAQALAGHWGQAGGWREGDFNHDFVVNAADASILAANWGYGTSEATNVPEPSVLALLGMGVVGLLFRRRRVGP